MLMNFYSLYYILNLKIYARGSEPGFLFIKENGKDLPRIEFLTSFFDMLVFCGLDKF